ncbi:hypothetical protein Tco_1067869 [Tanacetum coccineum]|uniref:Uncharacterized protein n=1 Tax=Tanacetum coccineum TaxID=301880 RepID=A0ABQ5HG08_9ASTR
MKPKPNKAKENPSFSSVVNGVVALNGKSSIDKGGYDEEHILYVSYEGFDNLKISDVGGLWVWIQFPNANACSNFKYNGNMKTMFNFKSVGFHFVHGDRLRIKRGRTIDGSNDRVPDDIEADIPTKFDLDQQGPTFANTGNHLNNLGNQKAKANEEEENDKNETNANNESDKSCPPGFKHMK